MRISAHGMAADLPGGWDARIYRRPPERPEAATHPVLHAGNFALPAERGDYGSGAVELMSAAHVLVVLLEFGAEAVDRPLFAPRGRPSPVPYAAFRPDGLQRAIQGQAGAQFFFTENGRPFCLYVVLGSYVNRSGLAPVAAGVVDRLQIEPVTAGPAGGP